MGAENKCRSVGASPGMMHVHDGTQKRWEVGSKREHVGKREKIHTVKCLSTILQRVNSL